MTIERIPCVYIVASGYNGALYVGVTSNLIGRILQHRAGTFDGHTKKYRIKRLVYFEIAETMEAAIAREKQLKRYRRDWKRNLIERENPAWNDLAVGLGLSPVTA
ncbi:GIY-YIG nuclease family protein [Sphingomonas psychrolutea]|uniref:Nuclease n=1 Tax=Sphingomonas psychrolutea TaxID=1259676 RepID=A0ABQ1H5A1_9SPHN|nr:GIY-YIG nuclease family protein [Sphingomonas psychrolutea]GGA57854.1 nuclease [Sphingomonas psychrolutea]